MLTDTHAHLTMPEFQDLNDVLDRSKQAGIEFIIDVAYDLESSKKTVRLAEDHDIIYSAVGIHPHDAKSADKDSIKLLTKLLQMPKIVALGESGLDYHYDFSSHEEQRNLFIKMIGLAREFSLPILIHGRESYEDIIDIIETEGKGEVSGVFHSFTGNIEQANWAIQNNFLISFSGMLTFKKAVNIVDIAKAASIEKVLIETDCPYLTPVPFRGKRNEPSYVKYVAEKLAEIKNLTMEEVGKVTTQNAKALFKI